MKAGGTNVVIHTSTGGSGGSATCQIGVCGGVDNGGVKGDVSIGIGASHTFFSTAFGSGTGARISTNETISQASKVIGPDAACDIASQNVCYYLCRCRFQQNRCWNTSNGSSGTNHDTVSIAIGTSHGASNDTASTAIAPSYGAGAIKETIGARTITSNGAGSNANHDTASEANSSSGGGGNDIAGVAIGVSDGAGYSELSSSIGTGIGSNCCNNGAGCGVVSTRISSTCKIPSAVKQSKKSLNCNKNTGIFGVLSVLTIKTTGNEHKSSIIEANNRSNSGMNALFYKVIHVFSPKNKNKSGKMNRLEQALATKEEML